MLATLIILAVFIIAGGAYAAVPKDDLNLNIDRLVEAIRQTENWDGHSIGAAGERGAWQLKPSVWKQFSRDPLWVAEARDGLNMAEQRRVARELVIWIGARAHGLGLKKNPYHIGLVWNAGYGNAQDHRISRANSEFADRVSNIYEELSKKAPHIDRD